MITNNFQIIPVGDGKKVFFNRTNNYKSPAYRKISRIVGQYMKTFDGELYGFMNIHRDICPPRFTSLPDISELFFYGFARMKIEKLWGLVSSSGYDILKAQFDEIYIHYEVALDKTVVIVGKNGLYGLCIPENNLITEIKYTDFELKQEYILTFSNELQGILLYDGTEVFEPVYTEVEEFYGMYMATKPSGKKILKSMQWLKESAEADEFYPPVRGGIRAKICKSFAMIDAETGRNLTQFIYRELTNFDGNGYAYARDGLGISAKRIDRKGVEYSSRVRMLGPKD